MTEDKESVNEDDIINKCEKKDIHKSIKVIAHLVFLSVSVAAITFAFRYVNLIPIIALRITLIYLIYIIMIGLVVLLCRVEKRKIKELGFFKEKMQYQILIGIGIAVALSFLIGALPILIGGKGASLIGGKPIGVANIAYSIVTDLIFIGTVEELIFRGYIQRRINELTNHRFIGVLVAAALFGIWHLIKRLLDTSAIYLSHRSSIWILP